MSAGRRSANEILKLKRIIGHLRTAENMATELQICLDNGGEVSSLVGSMADELDLKLCEKSQQVAYPNPSTVHYSAEAKEADWKDRGFPKRSCNRHDDCDKAEEEVMARKGIQKHEISFSFHCYDDECEDCFGQ